MRPQGRVTFEPCDPTIPLGTCTHLRPPAHSPPCSRAIHFEFRIPLSGPHHVVLPCDAVTLAPYLRPCALVRGRHDSGRRSGEGLHGSAGRSSRRISPPWRATNPLGRGSPLGGPNPPLAAHRVHDGLGKRFQCLREHGLGKRFMIWVGTWVDSGGMPSGRLPP